jgi:hypothetical protein
MKRRIQPEGAPGGLPVFPDEAWLKKLPTICEYLADDAWDDGSPRELSTVSIKCVEGRVVAVLNDPEERRSLYVSGESVMKAMESLERALGSPQADWRRWQGSGKKPAKRA